MGDEERESGPAGLIAIVSRSSSRWRARLRNAASAQGDRLNVREKRTRSHALVYGYSSTYRVVIGRYAFKESHHTRGTQTQKQAAI